MHYKNGRLAQENDQVIWNPAWSTGDTNQKPRNGVVFQIQPNVELCNGALAYLSPGSVQYQYCINLKDCLHIEDAVQCWNTVSELGAPAQPQDRATPDAGQQGMPEVPAPAQPA